MACHFILVMFGADPNRILFSFTSLFSVLLISREGEHFHTKYGI